MSDSTLGMATISIRTENQTDGDAARHIHISAFGAHTEADLVDQLKADGDVTVSLVATDGSALFGHILFSPLAISDPGDSLKVVSLAPLAIIPEWQRRGIGSMLVRKGIQVCDDVGVDAIIVVGAPEYYERFGFSSGLATKVRLPYSGPACMALEVRHGALDIDDTVVTYPDAFSRLS